MLQRGGGDGIRDRISYVHGIAKHKLQDRLRMIRTAREVPAEERVDDKIGAMLRQVSAEHELIETERRQKVVEGLKNLSPQEREFLMLRYYLDLSNDEACRRLKIAPEVGSRLKYNALEHLRAGLSRRAASRQCSQVPPDPVERHRMP